MGPSRDRLLQHSGPAQDQPTEPIIASLGRELPECAVTIDKLSLVVQWGPEREWAWEVVGTAGIGRERHAIR